MDKKNIFTVKSETPLMKFLIEKTDNRKQVKTWLKYKSVRVNGSAISQFDHLLKAGDQVWIEHSRIAAPGTDLPSGIKILHEDEDLIVIHKPEGLLTIATENEKERTAYFKLNTYLKRRDPFKETRVWIIHRLDRETSGLLVFAKSESTKKKLQLNWHLAHKKYEAVIEGKIQPEDGEIRSYLKEGAQFKMKSTPLSKEGQLAITQYKTIAANGKFSLLEIDLKTGRKNQIRVHLSEKGKPIVGDDKYGSTIDPIKRLALHATYLEFNHPKTSKTLKFQLPSPSSFKVLTKKVSPTEPKPKPKA